MFCRCPLFIYIFSLSRKAPAAFFYYKLRSLLAGGEGKLCSRKGENTTSKIQYYWWHGSLLLTMVGHGMADGGLRGGINGGGEQPSRRGETDTDATPALLALVPCLPASPPSSLRCPCRIHFPLARPSIHPRPPQNQSPQRLTVAIYCLRTASPLWRGAFACVALRRCRGLPLPSPCSLVTREGGGSGALLLLPLLLLLLLLLLRR